MNALASRIRTNIIYGAIALLPVAALIFILAKLFDFLKKLSEPLAPYLGSNTYLATLLLIVLTLVILLALCYLFGALVNTQLGAMSFERIEKRLRDVIPGYEITGSERVFKFRTVWRECKSGLRPATGLWPRI